MDLSASQMPTIIRITEIAKTHLANETILF